VGVCLPYWILVGRAFAKPAGSINGMTSAIRCASLRANHDSTIPSRPVLASAASWSTICSGCRSEDNRLNGNQAPRLTRSYSSDGVFGSDRPPAALRRAHHTPHRDHRRPTTGGN